MYADADGSMSEDWKAISGCAFLVNGGVVSWSAKRQEIISLSTTESEYVAAVYAAKEALWLRSLIPQLSGIEILTTTLFSDNQSAIALTKEHQYHARTKHIDIRFSVAEVWFGSIALLPEPNLNQNQTIQNRFYQFGLVLEPVRTAEPPKGFLIYLLDVCISK